MFPLYLKRIFLLSLLLAVACQQSSPDTSGASNRVYVFSSYGTGASPANLNLGGRAGSTTTCTTIKNTYYSSLSCTNIRALISIGTDNVVSMTTNHGVPSSYPVYRSDGTTLITDTWSGFANGTATLSNSVLSVGTNVATGTGAAGTSSIQNCTSFGATAGNCATGSTLALTGGLWLNNGSSTSCGSAADILCICW